jgi:hypothetical protein
LQNRNATKLTPRASAVPETIISKPCFASRSESSAYERGRTGVNGVDRSNAGGDQNSDCRNYHGRAYQSCKATTVREQQCRSYLIIRCSATHRHRLQSKKTYQILQPGEDDTTDEYVKIIKCEHWKETWLMDSSAILGLLLKGLLGTALQKNYWLDYLK